MGLFKPAWQSENQKKRVKGIKKLTDQSILANIAISDKKEYVRWMAFEKITDEAALAYVAIHSELDNVEWGRSEMGDSAAEKLTDQAALASVAKKARSRNARYIAVCKLTDQAALAYVVKNEKDEHICSRAAAKLTDKALIADYARKHLKELNDGAIIDMIDDKDLLEIIARNTEITITGIREQACNKIGHILDGNNNCRCSRCGVIGEVSRRQSIYGFHDFKNDICTRCGAVRFTRKHDAHHRTSECDYSYDEWTEMVIRYSNGEEISLGKVQK